MLAETAGDLATIVRSDLDDKKSSSSDVDCLWKDDDLYRYMTSIADKLAKKTASLYRTIELDVIADEPLVELPAYVQEIRSVKLVDGGRSLDQRNANETFDGITTDYGRISATFADAFDTTGEPDCFVRDYDEGALRLVPIPTDDDTLEIQCTVTIEALFESDTVLPFTDAEEQELLLTVMKWKAYEKNDAETEDLVRADRFKKQFEDGLKEYGVALRNKRRAPGLVRCNWD